MIKYLFILVLSSISFAQGIGGTAGVGGKAGFGGGVSSGGSSPTKQTSNACGGFSPVTCSFGSVTSGWILHYAVITPVASQTFTVTDNQSNTYTTDLGPTVGSIPPGSIGATAQTGHATAGSTGSVTLTISVTGGTSLQIQILSISGSSGLDQVAAFNGQSIPGTGSNALVSNSVTTLHTDLCVGYTADAGVNGGTVTSGTSTVAWNTGTDSTSFGQGNEYFAQSGAGAITAAFQNSSTFATTVTGISCFKP